MQPKEEVLAISPPLGYAAEEYNFTETVLSVFGYHHRRKELADLCPDGMEETWPAWVKTGLEAARLAPSAVNRQPWRFLCRMKKNKDSYRRTRKFHLFQTLRLRHCHAAPRIGCPTPRPSRKMGLSAHPPGRGRFQPLKTS